MESEGYVLAVDFSEGEIQVPQFEIILSKFPSLKVAIGHFGMPNRVVGPGNSIYVTMRTFTWSVEVLFGYIVQKDIHLPKRLRP